uniref:hypothetical protein n=1 Tax=uncultured Erythrobacter sp. TaxID=263913 RepID=UPI00261F47CA|nr:hypothetical protein [uncultured Erythrobacter sp.]
MRAAFACVVSAFAAMMVTAPAAARDFVSYASTTPILYRYAACAFDGGAATVEAQIEKCAKLKSELSEEAKIVIRRFHVLERADVERELREGFREIERDIRQTRDRNKPVPPAIVAYLKCMGEGAMATEDYQAGDAVTYIGVEGACEDSTIAAAKDGLTKGQKISTRALYLRFQRRGRLTFPLARQALRRSPGGTRLLPAKIMDRSFLNIGLIKKATND